MRPSSANFRSGSFERIRFWANSAISSGVAAPTLSALSMSRPETPKGSEMTPESLMLALSSSLMMRLRPSAPGIDQLDPITQEQTQLPQLRRRDVTRLQQAVAQQVCDPLGIFDIGLASRHGLDVTRIGDDQLEVTFEDVVDRLPVNASRFHRDGSTICRRQPVAQFNQAAGHG